jgi:precorrin-6Y C5,15-methyltransferase (decarboxylating)
MEKLYIIGFGPGDETLWTEKAKNIIQSADRILTTNRIGRDIKNAQNCTLSQLTTELENKIKGVTAVLVSGDCGFFSVSKTIVRDFSKQYDIELISGISSVSYLSAKLSVPYDDAVICSMHGKNEQIAAKVSYNKKVFALTGGEFKAHDICRILHKSGLPGIKVIIGEKLSYPDERIVEGTAEKLKGFIFDDLSVMYIENNLYVNPHLPLRDEDFIRGDIPMTKAETRWLSISKLGILPSDIVYDIGAGTGSVSIEMARKAFDGFVYAIETKKEACELIEQNKIKHGAYNLEIIHAMAPDKIDNLPKPDKVFIGGSSKNLPEILNLLHFKNPSVKIVSNAVTLQSVGQIITEYENLGFVDIDIICVNIAKSKKINNYDMMTAQNPIYIITGQGVNANE